MKHFTAIADCTPEQLRQLLDVSYRLKKQHKETGRNDPILVGKTLALVFEKPSLRTRVSFSVAMTHLGGSGLILRDEEVGLGKREPVQDVARVLSGMCDGIMARTFEHSKVTDLAKHATVPVINGLTDYSHPCQAMADVMTLEEHFGVGALKGKRLAYVGDGNNVARSLASACGKMGMGFVCATPPSYALPGDDVDRIMAQTPDMDFVVTNDPVEAVSEADCVYTDTWVSMGQEQEKAQRIKDFHGFRVDETLMSNAPEHAVVLHCLPAYRGLEISEGVMEGPQSLVFPQAENRLHFQKGLVAVLLGSMNSATSSPSEEHDMKSACRALLALVVVSSALTARSDDAKEAGGILTRVMSFNIRYGTAKDGEDRWENRRDALVKVIRAYDPDLFGTQEVLAEQQDFLQEQFPEYGFVGAGRDDGKRKGEASPIAYRKDRYDLQSSGMIWLSPTPEKVGSKGWDAALPRVATWTLLKDKKDGGREMFYVNTHWDHVGNVARVEAAKVMRKLIDDKRGDRPVIVTGDFNSTEDLPQYRTLTGADGPERARLIDAYREVHPSPAANEASFNGFKGTREGKRIDWILHSADYTATAATIDYSKTPAGRYPSDHYPVTADLKRK